MKEVVVAYLLFTTKACGISRLQKIVKSLKVKSKTIMENVLHDVLATFTILGCFQRTCFIAF